MANVELKRMWINQPSGLQPHHDMHGTNVLAYLEYEGTYRVYFLSGNTISQQMLSLCLSDGWIAPAQQATIATGKVRLGDRSAEHLYDVEVSSNGLPSNNSGGYRTVQVDANTRDQASRIATKAGYEVRSVNMVG